MWVELDHQLLGAASCAKLVQLGTAEVHEVQSPLFQANNAQQFQLDGPPI